MWALIIKTNQNSEFFATKLAAYCTGISLNRKTDNLVADDIKTITEKYFFENFLAVVHNQMGERIIASPFENENGLVQDVIFFFKKKPMTRHIKFITNRAKMFNLVLDKCKIPNFIGIDNIKILGVRFFKYVEERDKYYIK